MVVVVFVLAARIGYLSLILDIIAHRFLIQMDGYGVNLEKLFFQYLNTIIIVLILQVIDAQHQLMIPKVIIAHWRVMLQWKFYAV
jgi:hypothetical protein